MPLIITDVVKAARLTSRPLPVYLSRVEAGFPSPADDFMEGVLDLNDLCIENEAATFLPTTSPSVAYAAWQRLPGQAT